MDISFPFADWFRNSSTYIDAHRGRTFVVLIEGEGLTPERRAPLIQDLALLHVLGVRLVLVFGVRAQVREALTDAGLTPQRHQGRFVVDDACMSLIEREASTLRLAIEARLSPGLSNTPLHGVEINAISGNLVMAKPLGIREGVDFLRAGEVRRVRRDAIRTLLDQRSLVVLPPLGYSSTGEVFDLDAADIARHTAIALEADKLIIVGRARGLHNLQGRLMRQPSLKEAQSMVREYDDTELAEHVHIACDAARQGVGRTHLISWQDRDALLAELFTRDGVGTMITRERYEQLRGARLDDIGGLLELLRPLEERGMLVARSRERLEQEIDDYVVIERDGMVIGCAALHSYPEARSAELACVAVHTSYRGGERGDLLLEGVEQRARDQGLEALFALTTHTLHWFLERGFVQAGLDALPERRRQHYNPQRNSRVLLKTLSTSGALKTGV
ncbi:N-acetylglutamate synthase [Kushneria avicenniae]|uniref:Amino-acid acetyltransferase n=1 Tax=Kushneria avicenniae TaxID=402385 RepID=A0A1I1KRG8_9GAMM|nr:amino-acid N-acetyltransferase [Kushneria avicenniae]SFC62862.1 N-acetylglutamate synthase [Kushneria avicenniae]